MKLLLEVSKKVEDYENGWVEHCAVCGRDTFDEYRDLETHVLLNDIGSCGTVNICKNCLEKDK